MQANSGLITGNLRVLGKIIGPLDWSSITNKPSTFTPSAHTHGNSDLTGISDWAKASTKPSYGWGEITGKPSEFTPAAHNQAWSTITGKPESFTPSAHTHTKSQITDFAHTHTKSQITDFPTIPTVNNGTFDIYSDSTKIGGTSANTSTNGTVKLVSGTHITLTADASKGQTTIAHNTPGSGTDLNATNADSGTLTRGTSYVVTGVTLTKDNLGHVTGIKETRSLMPASDNTDTDEKVKQTSVSSANWRPLLAGRSNNPTEGFSPGEITAETFVTSHF